MSHTPKTKSFQSGPKEFLLNLKKEMHSLLMGKQSLEQRIE